VGLSGRRNENNKVVNKEARTQETNVWIEGWGVSLSCPRAQMVPGLQFDTHESAK